MPFDLDTKEFIDRDGKRHHIERLADRFIVSMTRLVRRRAVNNNGLAVLAILKAEADRRGLKVDTTEFYRLIYEGGQCFCGATALYVVGKRGFCRKHKARAVFLRRLTVAQRLKRTDEAAAMRRQHKRAADYRSLSSKSLKALKTR